VRKNVTIYLLTKFLLPNPAVFLIIRSRNLKQTFVQRPSCCLSFCKYDSCRSVSRFPTIYCHSEFHGQKTWAQEHHG